MNQLLSPDMIQQIGGMHAGIAQFPPPSYASYEPGSRFRVERIDNGFLVHLSSGSDRPFERHYAKDEKDVGELVTAHCIRFFTLEGK